jgi:hypothetical protein
MNQFQTRAPRAAAEQLLSGAAVCAADLRLPAQTAARAADTATQALNAMSDDDLRAMAHAAAQTLGGMPPSVVERLSENDLRALAQKAARDVKAAATALRMPPHVVARLPDAALSALVQATQPSAIAARNALNVMTPQTLARVSDKALIALVRSGARDAAAAAQALVDMSLHVAERLPESVLRRLAQVAAQQANTAAEWALGAMPPNVVARLKDDDVIALTQAAALWAALMTLARGAAQDAKRAKDRVITMPPPMEERMPEESLRVPAQAAAQNAGHAAEAWSNA